MSKSTAWTLGSIAKEVGGRLSDAADPSTQVLDFHIRAWSCRKGCLFIPLRYEDLLEGGNKLVKRAFGRGAVAAMVESTDHLEPDAPFILVDDLDMAAQRLAKVSREKFEGILVGITGTAGKSSTKAMLGHVLTHAGETWVTPSNQNLTPHITASLCGFGSDLDFAVMEMGLYRPETVRDSAQLARPHIAVITSIGMNHAEDFDDPYTGILKAKADIFSGLEPGGVAVLPSFSDRFEDLLEAARASERVSRIVTCGRREEDDVRLLNVEKISQLSRATIATADETASFDVPYMGEHMVENAVMVAGALHAATLPLSPMSLVASAPPPHSASHRYKMVYQGKIVELIDDSYNTGPLAVKAMVSSAAKRDDKRKLLLMCDIGGLVEKSEEVHESLIPDIDQARFDHVFTVGKAMEKACEKLKTPSSPFGNRFNAVKALQGQLKDGDLVYIKGTAAMGFKDVLSHLKKSASSMVRVGMDWVG